MTNGCALYEIWDDGALVYVGASIDPETRLKQHKAKGSCSRNASVKVVRWFAKRRHALHHEAERISRLSPAANTIHRGFKRARAGAMPVDLAGAVWLSSSLKETDRSVLDRMPGWTRNMAKHHFGSRGKQQLPAKPKR